MDFDSNFETSLNYDWERTKKRIFEELGQHHDQANGAEKDFGASTSQSVEERHGFEAQAPRRKIMARARNYLLSAALKPEHSWVYWRDSDIVDSPKKILEDFMAHDRDIIVPSM